jgi:hypothetical protein
LGVVDRELLDGALNAELRTLVVGSVPSFKLKLLKAIEHAQRG